MVEEDKAGIVWLFVRVFAFGMHRGSTFTGTERASATWRGWVLPRICNVCICECAGFFTCRWIHPLRLKKATEPEQRSFFRWQMEMITPLCWCWPPYRNVMMCALYTFAHASSSSAPLFPPRLYIHMYQLAGVSVLWQRTLGRFSPQWPLILSCKTWCRCYMHVEYWVNPV